MKRSGNDEFHFAAKRFEAMKSRYSSHQVETPIETGAYQKGKNGENPRTRKDEFARLIKSSRRKCRSPSTEGVALPQSNDIAVGISSVDAQTHIFGEPEGEGNAFRIMANYQQALVKIKVENANQAAEISKLQCEIEKEKKSAAVHLLSLERMKECVICQAADKCVAFFPCSHVALCHECQHLVEECPMCRRKVEERKMVKLA